MSEERWDEVHERLEYMLRTYAKLSYDQSGLIREAICDLIQEYLKAALEPARDRVRDMEERVEAMEAVLMEIRRLGLEGGDANEGGSLPDGPDVADGPAPAEEDGVGSLPTYRESCKAVNVLPLEGSGSHGIHEHIRAHAEQEIEEAHKRGYKEGWRDCEDRFLTRAEAIAPEPERSEGDEGLREYERAKLEYTEAVLWHNLKGERSTGLPDPEFARAVIRVQKAERRLDDVVAQLRERPRVTEEQAKAIYSRFQMRHPGPDFEGEDPRPGVLREAINHVLDSADPAPEGDLVEVTEEWLKNVARRMAHEYRTNRPGGALENEFHDLLSAALDAADPALEGESVEGEVEAGSFGDMSGVVSIPVDCDWEPGTPVRVTRISKEADDAT